MYERGNKASQGLKAMFCIQVIQKSWDKPKSPVNKAPPTSKLSEVEGINHKSSQFARVKTNEYIRNTQQVYYLERRLFC
jgi:hypothetical protein